MNFSYSIKIGSASVWIGKEPYKELLPTGGNLVLQSDKFKSYDDCLKTMTSLLANLLITEAEETGRTYLIATKINPAINPLKSLDRELWEDHVIQKSFVASSEDLKKQVLKYDILGEIHGDGDITTLKVSVL